MADSGKPTEQSAPDTLAAIVDDMRAKGSPPVLGNIEVFVRLGDGRDDVRQLSFKPPRGRAWGARDLLAAGFAIDGNEATCAVTAWTDPRTGEYHPLAKELRRKQLELVKWFEERQTDVIFK